MLTSTADQPRGEEHVRDEEHEVAPRTARIAPARMSSCRSEHDRAEDGRSEDRVSDEVDEWPARVAGDGRAAATRRSHRSARAQSEDV